MKVLFLANRTPYPPHRGDKLKIFNLARRLCTEHEIYLIAFAENDQDFQYETELKKIFKEVHLVKLPVWKSWLNSALNFFQKTPFQIAYFRSRKMQMVLSSFLDSHEIDVIHTQHLRMSQYTSGLKGIRRILDLPDAYSLYWQRRKSVQRPLLNRIFDNLESKRVIRYESVVNQFDLNLVCSVEDRDHLRKIHPKARIDLLRNGVDLELFNFKGHDYSRDQTLLFTGNMDYAPNVDAVVWFVKELFPKILNAKPETRLVIAGQRPVKEVRDLASEKVEITGFVEDISAMYEQADVVIAPLRFGAGTQNKVLEALAMAVPVVCTNIGFKGLEVKFGEGVVLAETGEDFVKEVITLLSDEDLRKSVGQTGLRLAQSRFSWEGISQQLSTYLKGEEG
ncbi:MAG: glycosyltransferase [Bacteroidetes bacterium]|nr:glycosyltransferase [Bacteroidota bacterium]